MSGLESDLLFPEVVEFVGSALRVEDTIFRMTRNRAVFFLADADEAQAAEIMERVINGFHQRFATNQNSAVSLKYFEVTPDAKDVTVKQVLPALFAPPAESH
jgi:GGDEF domain-containing protein